MAHLSGDIELMPLSDLIAWIGNRAMTCSLQVQYRQVVTDFVVRDGKIRYTASSDPREYLGQHLINFGYISEDQLQKAFATQLETHVPLGRVLVMVESITHDQLARVLVFKARESLLEAMCWTEGAFKVGTDVPEDTDLDFEIPIDLLEVHSEGEARRRMWTEIRRVFPSDGTRCDVVTDPQDLSAFDRRLLNELSAGKSVGEASLEMRSMDFQTYARCYDLHNRGVIVPRVHEEVVELEEEIPDLEVDDMDVVAEGFDHGMASTSTLRPVIPQEAPGVEIPEEAANPAESLRQALAGRNWKEALILADRMIEVDPQNAEAIAARRVAEAQVRRMQQENAHDGPDLSKIPNLTVPRAQVATTHLTSKERYVLSRIDGRRTLQEIAAVSPIQRDELVRIIESFVSRGTLSLQ